MKRLARTSAARRARAALNHEPTTADELHALEHAIAMTDVADTQAVDGVLVAREHVEVVEPDQYRNLPQAPERRTPRKELERLEVRPEWTRDAQANVRWALNYAAHIVKFHAIRLPWYIAEVVGWTPRGMLRAVQALWRYGRDEEARALRQAHADNRETAEFLVLRDQARIRGYMAIGAGAVAVIGVVGGLINPSTRLGTLLFLVVTCGGVLGRPADRPAIPSAIVTEPSARRITPDVIMRALHAAKLCKEVVGPDAPEFVAPGVHRDGPGFGAIINLPYGFTATQAIERRVELAAGLRVDEFRLFVDRVREGAGHAGRIKLWIADKDPYSRPPVPSPLLKVSQFDLWRPVPFGTDERGRPVKFSLVWTSVLIGAIPRMGKTVAARVIACAAALDPYVRLITFDGKGGKDFDPFEQIAHRFGVGPDDEVAEHLRDVLLETQQESKRRYKRFRTLPTNRCPEAKLTPELARDRDLNMPLIVIVIDEFQRYLENAKYGGEIYLLLLDLAKVAPATGVILVLSTQRPSGKTMPTELRDNIGTRFALRVTTREFSEMILGSGSYKAGLDASQFLSSHKGAGILLGADDGELTDRGGIKVRTDLIDLAGLEVICARARSLREGADTLSGVAAGEVSTVLSDNLLEHVHQAFRGRDRAQSWWLLRNLAEDYPNLYPTEEWGADDLAAGLARFDISGGNQIWGLRPDGIKGNAKGFYLSQIADALAARAAVPEALTDNVDDLYPPEA